MSESPTVLVIDDDTDLRYSLERVLSSNGYNVLAAASGEEGLKVAEKEQPTVILLDNRMGGMSGMETLQHLRHTNRDAMIILMTAFGTTQTAIEAMKFGAFDYIIKPFDTKKILSLTEKALGAYEDLNQEKSYTPVLNTEDYEEGIVGSSEPMQEVFKVIGQVAASDVTVMITGESGTGKELVARCICQHSHRSSKPFIAVNCAAIPENLIESELFGHEKGSFTGATTQRRGKFELCDGGTIFLDEIGDMTLSTQTKILRAIQEGEIQRVGGTETIKVDVRLTAATNKDLEQLVEEKEFREDLYYRLNVVRLRLPALRERLVDVPSLVDFMLQKLSKGRKTKAKRVSEEAMGILCGYPWPGNVRELENAIYRSAVIAQGETILKKDLPDDVLSASKPVDPSRLGTSAPFEATAPDISEQEANGPAPVTPEPLLGETKVEPSSLKDAYDMLYHKLRETADENLLGVLEKEMLIRAFEEMEGNQVKTASLLGITRATLRKRIEQFDLK
ncbi:sigma-54 dependent transcriptional regulator [Rubellicoccus peritrichatus]|uniref:DNA-binding transcriptional regulator NtrC n=1 Tax=Rubellicoccus peritrichatus TaxID=3080537 RepID=A0AAQ3QWK6_9BACT|nr:sigma-54 dependent transcriptional regulator [Puniceicoccus sp. CR14]WOO42813.1 sigma-54 dependent transcriptional regulator [Puniceicoccus sp. CR14]